MKKRDVKGKLAISKKTVSNFNAETAKGGTGSGRSHLGCTFPDQTCFSKGIGCSIWQVC